MLCTHSWTCYSLIPFPDTEVIKWFKSYNTITLLQTLVSSCVYFFYLTRLSSSRSNIWQCIPRHFTPASQQLQGHLSSRQKGALTENTEGHTHLSSCAAAHWTPETGCVTALTAQQSSPAVSSLAAAPSSVTVRTTNILILFPHLTEVISPSILHACNYTQSRRCNFPDNSMWSASCKFLYFTIKWSLLKVTDHLRD
jgi:hypothetical protein